MFGFDLLRLVPGARASGSCNIMGVQEVPISSSSPSDEPDVEEVEPSRKLRAENEKMDNGEQPAEKSQRQRGAACQEE